MDVLTTEHKNLGSNSTINDRAVTLTEALIYPFYERNAITRTDLTCGTVPWAPRSDKTFFILHLYLAGKYCKISKCQEPNSM